MKILVTGFKPFLGEKLNPSEMVAQDLARMFQEVHSLILPVEFESAFLKLKNHLQINQYNYVILMGQASGRFKIGLEKIALNWQQSEHADEKGFKPAAGTIFEGEALARMTSFDVDSVFKHLKTINKPVEISFSAGTFVCNDLYYRSLKYFNELKIVFIHVPMIKEQINEANNQNSLDYNDIFDTLKKLIEFLVSVK